MIALLLALALAAPAARDAVAPAAGDAVARVDGAAIPASRVRDRMALAQALGATTSPAELLQELVDDRLLAVEAQARGLGADPAVAAAAEAARRRAGQELFEERELGAAVPIDDKVLRSMYHSNGDSARLLLLKLASREEAEAALARIRAGAGFADEAKRSLDEASRLRGGDTGLVLRGQLDPALAEAVFAADPGALVGPLTLRLGFAVAKVVERTVGDEAGFQAKKASLLAYARTQVAAQARRHYVEQLRAKAKVALDEPFLRGLGSRLEVTEAEAGHVIATLPSGPLRYRDVMPGVQQLSRGLEGGHLSGWTVKAQVAWAEIDRRLLEDVAAQRAYHQDPVVVARAEWARQDALTRALADRLRAGVPPPSAAAVEAEYAARADAWRRPAQRPCAHILVPDERMAELVRKKAAAGETFASLAQAYSRDGSTAPQGGELGQITEPQLANLAKGAPALAAALRGAAPDALTGPVRSPDGLHLLRCGAWQPAGVTPLAEVRAGLQQELAARAQLQAVRAEVARLRARARIELDEAALSALSR